MQVLRDPQRMVEQGRLWRAEGLRVGFVPTMGFLHEGHTALMDAVRPLVDRLVVSIYVNPLQFGPNEDLDRYPRDPEGDSQKCQAHGTDLLFMPTDLYPDGFRSSVAVHGLTAGLCGASRPGHFDGVTTVVCRLFNLVGCHLAAFGEKDFQQLAVIQQMVRDLAMPVEILPVPLVRDTDGLALSSRNKYLDPDQRRRALSLSGSLNRLAAEAAAGERSVAVLIERAIDRLDCDALDYLEVVDAQTLEPLSTLHDRPARALVAARYGATRLIDNVGVA